MYPVFNRFNLDYDVYLDPWIDAEKTKTAAQRALWRALAFNVMYDFRVQPKREQRFHYMYGSAQPLHDALIDYFMDCVRHTSTPDFADPALNGLNIVSGAYPHNVIDHDTALVTFLDLNGLAAIYKWAKATPRAEYVDVFDLFSNDLSDAGVSRSLRDCFDRLGYEAAISGILAAKAAIRKEPGYTRFHPTWAGLWRELQPWIAAGDSDRWNELVGVLKLTAERWIVPMKYTVFEAGTLARPSILDANANSWHFPSPPKAPLRDGGCCMNLRTSPAPSAPIHEFVHQDMDFTLTHWHDAGSLCKTTKVPGPSDLGTQRRVHHAFLDSYYGDVLTWMPECV